MANKRKNETEDLWKQMMAMEDNPHEQFDEEAERKQMKMRLAQEEKEFKALDMNLKQLANKAGVQQDDFEPDLGNMGYGLDSPKGQKGNVGGSGPQQKKKNASEDLMQMINNMTHVDENEEFDEAEHRKNMARYKQEELDFQKKENQLQSIQGRLGIQIDNPQQQQQQKQQQPQPASKSGSQEDSLISQDEQYASLKDMICVSVFAFEYKNCEKYVQNQKYPKLYAHFSTKRHKINENINKFNTWVITGQLSVPDYLAKHVEPALANQERLRKSLSQGSSYASVIDQRIKYIKNEITSLKKDPSLIKKVFSNAFTFIGQAPKEQPKAPQMSATQILAASQDQLTIPEKIKLLSKLHKQNHNYTLFLNNNCPDKKEVINSHYIPTLKQSKEITEQLQNGTNVSIASFIETKLFEITPEVFHKQSIQDFEAKRNFYIEKFDLAIKSEYDVQKMTQNQKKAQKVKELQDQSNLRIKKYEQAKSYLQQINYNQYVLFPQITSQNIQLDFSFDNKNIDKNTIIFMIKRLVDCKADKYKISYSFTPEQAPLSHQTDWCNQSLVFSDERKFILQQNKLPKDLHKKKIDIIMYQKGFFSDSEFARGSISLADLETSNSIDSALILDHKGKHFQLEYGVYIRTPISSVGSKEMQIYEFKQYPALNINEGVDDYIKKNLDSMKAVKQPTEQPKPQQPQSQPQVPQQQPQKEQQQKPVQEQKQQQQQQQQQPQKQEVQPEKQAPPQQPQQQPQQQEVEEQKDEEYPGVNHIKDKFIFREANGEEVQKIKAFTNIPEGLTVEDLIDLENPGKYRCMTYLMCGIAMVKEGIAAGEFNATQRRAVGKIRDKFIEHNEILKIHVQNEKISQEDYMELQKKLLDDDNKLIWVYTLLGLNEWADFVQARKLLISQDLLENFEVEYQGKPYQP